ncbi:MAG: DUF4266 domain-containing protein [Myxococcota bacterium]
MRTLFLCCFLLGLSGCVRVSGYERGYLSEPTMQPIVDPLEQRADTQLHKAREVSSGGIWSPAGGGCGCTN